ncbi:S-layer homology domain-containing protein [Sporosalibacterium faouarense]|uniref:S-layer homology domain-containing protein n=1 Tax=Sporosalibacterium faouarense TaxID=516123 RepID=UPI001FAF2908|nr:S-layer homology domain-containing protein [Sporosalibacterium faouarense]
MSKRKRFFKLIILSVLVVLPYVLISPIEGQASVERFNMSYLYFGSKYNHVDYVDRANGALQVISPSYFDLNEDGSLKISKIFYEKFIEEMHDRDIKVVPFLSNHWDRGLGRKALENRESLSEEIAGIIEKYNLDGIHIDLENLTEYDRNNYTDFMRLLREKLPEGKEVSIAVAANPWGSTKGWQGSYDYKALAEYCDYLMIMAYDQSYYGSQPGPIAGRSFVEDAIKYAVDKIPSDKVVLGIPFYGRYWNYSESTGGRGVHLTDLDTLIKNYDANIYFDDTQMSSKATFDIKPGDQPYYVYGRRLQAGHYEVWYENEASIKAKIDLVKKYNLKGTGSWSLGQELPGTWDYFSRALNDSSMNSDYFYDIENHWAELDILEVKDKGWMRGFDNGLFKPDSDLTRAEAAVTIVRAFGLEKTESIDYDFKDVPDNYWAKPEIEIAKEHGIIKGVDNENFAPNKVITREEMTAMMSRVMDFEEIDQKLKLSFDDIDENRWSYDYIYTMTYYGLFRGYDDGTFHPSENITRAQIATLLNRVSKNSDKYNIAMVETQN